VQEEAAPMATTTLALALGFAVLLQSEFAIIAQFGALAAATILYPDSRYLAYFLQFYADEISRFQPEFAYEPARDHRAYFLLRDHIPAGLVIARPCRDDSLEIELDFVIPEYRDFKLGEFLYSGESGLFADADCREAWSQPGTSDHDRYLERVGFRRTTGSDGEARYVISQPQMLEPVS